MESVIGNKPKANVQANRYVQDDEFDDDIDGHEHLIQSAGLPLRQDAV